MSECCYSVESGVSCCTIPYPEPPEHGAEMCGQCMNGELFDGWSQFSFSGSGVTVQSKPGSKCGRCNGTGWVVVRAARIAT